MVDEIAEAESVTKALRTAVCHIAEHDRALGRYLQLTVHTGRFCRYPDLSGDGIDKVPVGE
jgi:hypothetical protein